MNSPDRANGSLETAAAILIRCFLMGTIMMFIWLGFLKFAPELSYRTHSATIPLSREHFNSIHYAAFVMTKSMITLLFLAPYIAIKLVLRRQRR